MSAKVMGGVFDLDLTPPQQIVLLAYADHADHFGKNVFPSKRLIAWKTGYGLRQVQRITDQLVSLKIMKVEQVKAGKSIKYSIDLSKGKKKPPFEEGVRQNVTPDIAMSSEGRQNVTPTHDMPVPEMNANHQSNHHIEPSVSDKSQSPFTTMKNAIHTAFGYDVALTTRNMWNLIGKAASELIAAGATPDDIPALYKYCASRFDNFKAMALASNWGEFKKSKPRPAAPVAMPLPASFDAMPAPVVIPAYGKEQPHD